MRHILIDWIVDVCFEFHLGPQSLYMSVEIIDFVLSKTPITKDRLQLLGICAMILACNIVNHGGIIPIYRDFSYISDNTYSVEEITEEVERIKVIIGTLFRDRYTLYVGNNFFSLSLSIYFPLHLNVAPELLVFIYTRIYVHSHLLLTI